MLLDSQRPLLKDRRFTCPAIERCIEMVRRGPIDPILAWMFENCFPNTLDTTVFYSEPNGKPDTFIITGDIDAMWLRDSAAQIHPYLPFTHEDPALLKLFIGTINRQVQCILLDPYANAFYQHPVFGEWKHDETPMHPGVHERKWELDSLCYFLRLSTDFYGQCGAQACFGDKWKTALNSVLHVFKSQQIQSDEYSFARTSNTNTETLALNGKGTPSRPCGLIRSAFRPSDDACTLPFLIPSNWMAKQQLERAAQLCRDIYNDEALAQECIRLSQQIGQAIHQYGLAEDAYGRSIFAYEVDGYGGQLIMDDANIPSLLSLPYLGCCSAEDPIYQTTRSTLLCTANPYYFKGEFGEGIGGPHIGLNYIWPMSIIMRALTSNSDSEIADCLEILKTTHAGTGLMHESYHADDPENYTRPWFGWVNSLFGELILKLRKERAHLLNPNR